MKVETLIIGGTFAGLSFGLKNPDSSILIDSSACLGWEFVEAMQPGCEWDYTQNLSDDTQALHQELSERKLVCKDKVHLAPLPSILFKKLKTSKLPFLFLTHIIDAQAIDDGFHIKIYNQDGHSDIYAKNILDTTNLGYRQQFEASSTNINLILHQENSDAKIQENIIEKNMKITPGLFASEAYLSLPIQNSSSWQEARETVHQFWVKRPEILETHSIASISTRLDTEPSQAESRKGDYIYHPSRNYKNPLEAYSAGEKINIKEGALL